MGKKAIWILVAVLALALIGGGTAFGVSMWKTAQVEKQIEDERIAKVKAEAEAAQILLDRNNNFLRTVRAGNSGLAAATSEAILAIASELCEIHSDDATAIGITTGLEESEDLLFDRAQAITFLEASITNFCPEKSAINKEAIESELQAVDDAEAEEQRKKELEEQAKSKASRISIDKFVSAVRKNVVPFKRAPDSELVKTGQAVCDSMKLGVSTEAIVIAAQQDNVGMTMTEAYFFVATSIGTFCMEETN